MKFARANMADCVDELGGGRTRFESYLKATIDLNNIWKVVLSIPQLYCLRKKTNGRRNGLHRHWVKISNADHRVAVNSFERKPLCVPNWLCVI